MIRRATTADAPAIARLEEVALGPDAWSLPLVEDGVAGRLPTIHYLVAQEAGLLAGYVVVSAAGDVAELQRIAVDPDRRRSGIASALLQAGIDAAASPGGAERMLLEVREDNSGALAFYAARGFAEIARRRRYYRDGATAVVMELPLTGPDANVCSTS